VKFNSLAKIFFTGHVMTEDAPHQGAGSRRRIQLRPGLDLHIAEFKPRECVKLQFESRDPCVRFTFLREGRGYMDWRVSSGTAVTRKVLPIERSSAVSFFPDLAGTVCFPGGHRQSHFSIQISQSLLGTLLGGRFQRIPHDLQAIFDGCSTIDFCHYGLLSPVMDAAILQLLRCPYSGALGLIYRESKVMELIAHKLAQIESCAKPAPEIMKLRLDDVERVRFAKEILARNLENPPRLFDLARTVGTSHTQLNQGFRKMYGTSVFGYLRKLRLDEARNLLEKGNSNVTEAALAVGYNSISSFTRAFSEHFGLNPMKFMKRSRGARRK
jgi:AraC family transcriptional regulator, transcriptional activator of the genes for pyochelin and ferripyochelin receptors